MRSLPQNLPASTLRWLNEATQSHPIPDIPVEAMILARHTVLTLEEAVDVCVTLGPERSKVLADSLLPQEDPQPPKNAFLRYFRLSSLAFWR